MAAGFSIDPGKIEEFTKRINSVASPLLTEEILTKRLKIDLEISFENIGDDLLRLVRLFEPTGIGNPTPTFISKGVSVVEARVVGREATHLKLKLKQREKTIEAIAFGLGRVFKELSVSSKVDIAYCLEENTYNGKVNMQLKVKDLKLR